ncbi:MAG: hypothetical protein V1753_05600 [Pseudomonadota bacterium]
MRQPKISIISAALISFCLILSGCKGPESYLHATADFSYIKKVAIAPFSNFTNDKFASGRVMNVVATEILRRGFFDVVEFGEAFKVLGEEGLKEGGLLTKEIAERAGKRLNVEAIIIGSVHQYGDTRVGNASFPEVSLSLKLIDISSYAILWESTHNLKGDDISTQLFGIGSKSPDDLCRKLVSEMLDTLFI